MPTCNSLNENAGSAVVCFYLAFCGVSVLSLGKLYSGSRNDISQVRVAIINAIGYRSATLRLPD